MEGQRATKETRDEKYETMSDGELWSMEEEARVRRQLDWRLIHLLTVLYLLCFTDRWVTGWLYWQ